MREYKIDCADLKALCPNLKFGDKVILSGTVYTARDAAHKRIFELIEKGEALPFDIKDAVIYFAGPTPTPANMAIGSCGPTTSKRMDPYTPKLHDMGLCATIGKGERSQAVIDSIIRNQAVYLCAIGGAGFVTLCDLTARLVFAPYELPVGILLSVIGGPFFIFLLLRQKGGRKHA